MRSFNVILLASSVLAGCAATGATFPEQLAALSSVPASSGRLVFFRTRDSAQYSGASASIKIDSNSLGTCDYAGFNVFDVKPGKHLLTVDYWSSPGTCNLPIDVAGGNEYFIEIKPRKENLTALNIFGYIGAAIESSGRECGGAFSVELVPRDIATPRLTDLKMTK